MARPHPASTSDICCGVTTGVPHVGGSTYRTLPDFGHARYRIETNPAGTLDVEEIGPRLVLLPTRIIASGFGGAILQERTHTAARTQLPQ